MDDSLGRYDYDLPPGRIAQRPAERRDASRLLALIGEAAPAHHVFADLPNLLQSGDLLVRNDTRVIPARLMGKRSGGGKTELLLVHPAARDPKLAADASPGPCWLCLARPSSHLKPGRAVTFGDGELTAVIEKRLGGGHVLARFEVESEAALMDAVRARGQVPLPPYIGRAEGGPDADDAVRYQTTFAREAGAVAAPTAGLHFTPELDEALRVRGIECVHLTLHVGPGTFRPIIAANLDGHAMDAEYYEIPPATAEAINRAKEEKRRVVAVGTTSTRALEASAQNARVVAGSGWTDLFIRPGHGFRIIDGLITNFHLPRSSLLVLVSALAGRERILEAYRVAVEEGYRFYSYGDAMLIAPSRGRQ